MKAPPTSSRNVLHCQLPQPDHQKVPAGQAKTFDDLVARYYPVVYSFACRFTDDPLKARVLTGDAFNSTRNNCRPVAMRTCLHQS